MFSRAQYLSLLITFHAVFAGATSAVAQNQTGRAPRGLVRSLGSTAYRHPEAIEYACLDPTGRILYTLSYKGAYAWNLESGKSRLLFQGDRVRNALSVSPDGRQIASIAGDAAGLWDAKTGAPIREFDCEDSPSSIVFRPDGQGVILVVGDSIEYRSLDGKESRVLGKTWRFCRPAFAPGRGWFAAALPEEEAEEIAIYDVGRLRRTAVLRVGPAGIGTSPKGLRMVRAGFSSDGRRIAVPAADGSIGIWDVANGKVAKTLPPAAGERLPKEENCLYFLFTSDQRQLFAGTAAGTIRRWDVEAGQELSAMRGHRESVRSLHLTPDGARLISTSADGTVRRWEVMTGREIEPPDGYSGALHAQLGSKGETVLLLDSTGRMDIWDLGTGRIRTAIRRPGDLKIETPWVEPLFGFTGDGRQVYVAQSRGRIESFDADSGRPAGSFVLPDYGARPKDLRSCVSLPDGQSFVVNRGRRLVRIKASDGGILWESPELTPLGLCYPPIVTKDGKDIVLGVATLGDRPATSFSGKLEVVRLDLASGRVVARTELKSAAPGSPSLVDQPRLNADGRLMLLWFNVSELLVMDTVTNRPLHHHVQFLERPDLAPDGRRIIGYFSDAIVVLDAGTGKPVSRLPIGPQTVQSLHVLPDGRHLLTAGDGSHACLWDLDAALPAEGAPE